MRKFAQFADFIGYDWPSLEFLRPYFFSSGGKVWFDHGGSDAARLGLEGLDETEHLRLGEGRIQISLDMWGNPKYGVLLIWSKYGKGPRIDYTSKGDLSRLRELTRGLHGTPLPIGLFIPFDEAWKAVKEFIETEGQLPKSIEWIKNSDLPPNTFPDP